MSKVGLGGRVQEPLGRGLYQDKKGLGSGTVAKPHCPCLFLPRASRGYLTPLTCFLPLLLTPGHSHCAPTSAATLGI